MPKNQQANPLLGFLSQDFVRAAGRAAESVGPAHLEERLLALGFGAVEGEEGGKAEAFLELDLVLGHETARELDARFV